MRSRADVATDQNAGATRLATERAEAGHTVYAAVLLYAQLAQWGDVIESVEAGGWKLEHVTPLIGGSVTAFFRRLPPALGPAS